LKNLDNKLKNLNESLKESFAINSARVNSQNRDTNEVEEQL